MNQIKFLFFLLLVSFFTKCSKENKLDDDLTLFINNKNNNGDFLVFTNNINEPTLTNLATSKEYFLDKKGSEFVTEDKKYNFKIEQNSNEYLLKDENRFFVDLSSHKFEPLPFKVKNINNIKENLLNNYWLLTIRKNKEMKKDSIFYYFKSDHLVDVYSKGTNSNYTLMTMSTNYCNQFKHFSNIRLPLSIIETDFFVVANNKNNYNIVGYKKSTSEFNKLELEKFESVNKKNILKGDWKATDLSDENIFPAKISFNAKKAIFKDYEINYELGLNSKFISLEYTKNEIITHFYIDVVSLDKKQLVLKKKTRLGNYICKYSKIDD